MKNVLVSSYDGTSRVPGVSLGAVPLWEALRATRAASEWKPRFVREETKSSALWCAKLHAMAAAQPFDLALGGEHLITFPLLEVLVQRHPGLRVVVLDAHHDAYDYPLLTHYSLFHYTRDELGIPGLMLGVRHELEKSNPDIDLVSAAEIRQHGVSLAVERMREFVGDHPFYFSVDLDVVSPEQFGAVSDPIANGVSIEQLVELTRAALSLKPIAADIVEYNALRDPGGAQLARLRPFFEEVACWLG